VIVILIVGVLISVAVPSYINLQERADRSAAMGNVRAATSDVEAYYSDNGTFAGISATVLHNNYDLQLSITNLQVNNIGGTSFMICSKSNSFYGFKDGPAALVDSSSSQPHDCTL
jgi:Tfp pilus assembly protein PilE